MIVLQRSGNTVEEGYALYYEVATDEGGIEDGGPDDLSFAVSEEEARENTRIRRERMGDLEDRLLETANGMSVGNGTYLPIDADKSPCHKAYRLTATVDYERGELQNSKILSEEGYRFRVDNDYI